MQNTEIKAPSFPESVQDGTIQKWHVAVGEAVARDQLLVEVETDKVVLEVVAPGHGKIAAISKYEGDVVASRETIAVLERADAAAPASAPADPAPDAPAPERAEGGANFASPAARKLAQQQGLDTAAMVGTGRGGRITKEDVQQAIKSAPAAPSTPAPAARAATPGGERSEQRVPMSRLRARIAERLLASRRDTAMLTTFNELNMQPLMDLRARHGKAFEERHGVRLGYMSLFVRAACEALRRFPEVNASMDGPDIIYHGYIDMGIAVSSERGLVVPVLRNAQDMSLADMEHSIRTFGTQAQEGKLSLEDLQGGTFTISNGGIFGNLLSTPILNPPQTAILGMHRIQQRPVVLDDGSIAARPMMYLALSYDHRLIDGREAVQFLIAIRDALEDPARMLLQL